ncbi:hypothetical protein ACQPZZ_38690 [Microbispora sp. CA-135349]
MAVGGSGRLETWRPAIVALAETPSAVTTPTVNITPSMAFRARLLGLRN